MPDDIKEGTQHGDAAVDTGGKPSTAQPGTTGE